jgi:hypothetical protein
MTVLLLVVSGKSQNDQNVAVSNQLMDIVRGGGCRGASESNGGFIKGILRGVRCTKSLRVLFLHRRPPSWTTLVLYSRAVFLFNEPALK